MHGHTIVKYDIINFLLYIHIEIEVETSVYHHTIINSPTTTEW